MGNNVISSSYGIAIMLLGLLPFFGYIILFPNEKDALYRKHQFGGWYFICELLFYFIVGILPAIVFFTLSYVDLPHFRLRVLVIFFASIIIFPAFLFTTWFRMSGYNYKTRLRDFRPFMREIRGKNPHPESCAAFSVEKPKSTWLFKGCSTSIILMSVTLIVMVWLLISA